jgi:hypothetical protein
MRYYIAIPSYNGGRMWRLVVENIKNILLLIYSSM